MGELMPHIRLSEDDSAPYALLPGDPGRLDRIGECLDDVEELRYNREYRSLRGTFKGVPVLALSTGIGGASTVIAVEELARIGVKAMIRIGSCGALQPDIRFGELVLANGAVRGDGASKAYVDGIYPAVPDTKLLLALMESAGELLAKSHVGLVRSHDSFYIDDEAAVGAYWSERGVLGADMETAALFVVGGLRGIKTASILNTVVEWGTSLEANIGSYANGEAAMMQGERLEILIALHALLRFHSKIIIKKDHKGEFV